MKQDEEGWTEKAAGLLGCRCMSSVALGALGRLASRDRLHGEGFRRVGGWAWIAQLVKNQPAMQDISVQFLSQEDLLEKG